MNIVKAKSSIIIIGESHEYIDEMNRTLKDDFSFYRTEEPKTIKQISVGYEKISLLFSDPQSCVKFLKSELSSQLSNHQLYLVMERNGKFKEETETAHREAGVRIFIPRLFQDLISDLKDQAA